MDRAEQLADYLAGHLEPDERTALEAELVRDPRLRTQLDAMLVADEALGALRSPSPTHEFEHRLDAALSDELDRVLGSTRSDEPDPLPHEGDDADPGDELAARRARPDAADHRHGLPRWVTTVSGAAAALVLLGGAGLVASGVLGGDDDEAMFDTTMESMDTLDDSDMDAPAAEADSEAAAAVDGPLLLADDRRLEEADVQSLLADRGTFAMTELGLPAEAAAELAEPYRRAFDAGPTLGAAPDTADEADDAADGEADGEAETEAEERLSDDDGLAAAALRVRGEVSSQDLARVAECLATVVGPGDPSVVVYAELATFEDEPAIVFGLVTQEPQTGQLTRREAWVLSRETCDVRFIAQG